MSTRRTIGEFVVGWLESFATVGFLLCPILGVFVGTMFGAEELGGVSGIAGGVILGGLIGTFWGILFFGFIFLFLQTNYVLKDIRNSLREANRLLQQTKNEALASVRINEETI
ncbi:MAG: hypothetical protein ACOYJ2_03400 [Rickettsiales bacterium]